MRIRYITTLLAGALIASLVPGQVHAVCTKIEPCESMSEATIAIRDSDRNKGDHLKFKAILHSDIGNPISTDDGTDYHLCIFDAVNDVVYEVDILAGPPWVERRGKFRYIDREALNQGVRKFQFQPQRKDNHFKVRFQAKGENTVLPGPISMDQYLPGNGSAVLQIENSDGSCWSVGFGAKTNKPGRYRGKH